MNKLVIAAIIGIVVISIGTMAAFVVLQPKNYTVTLSVVGGGKVSFQPQGGYQTALQVLQGTTVTINAIPDPGYKFSSWSGDKTGIENPTTFVVQNDMKITAIFLPII